VIFAPRKKIIQSRFKQRGNIISLFPPLPSGPPEIDTFALSQCIDMTPGSRSPVGVWVSEDGEKLGIADLNVTSPDKYQQFSMTTPHDLTTLTGVESTRNFTTPVRIAGFFFREDGLRYFSTSRSPNNFVTATASLNDLSPPFNLASQGQAFTFNIGTDPFGIHFTPDGLNCYIIRAGTTVWQIEMSSAWDLTTGVVNNTFVVTGEVTAGRGITFDSSGTRMFIVDVVDGIVESVIYQYNLLTPFDVSTAVFSGKSLGLEQSDATGCHMVGDDKLYICYAITAPIVGVCKFLLAGNFPPPPPPPLPIGNASDYYLFQISDANPGLSGGTRLDCFWKDDGTKVYAARQNSTIRQYAVSPPWGIDSGDWTFEASTGALIDLRSVWWSPDGTVLSQARRISTSSRVTV